MNLFDLPFHIQEFPEDFDPFAATPDTQPKAKPGVGYQRKQKNAWQAFDGPNPEINKEAYRALKDDKKAATKPKDEFKRLVTYCQSLGYFAVKTEYREANYTGMIIKKDFMGFGDLVGFKAAGNYTELLAIQATTKAAMASHIRKMASTEEVAIPGIGKRPYIDMVRAFLNANGKLLLIGWYQEGSRWAFETTWVTEDVLQKAIARKRK